MITERTIWRIFQRHMPRRQWISTAEMNNILETHADLGDDDWRPHSPHFVTPSWKVRVRKVLANRTKKGIIRSRKHTA